MEQAQPTSFKKDYLNFKKKIESKIWKPKQNKGTVPHELPKQKMEPALKKAVEQGDAGKATFIALSESSIIRGGLLGAILTSLIGFNAGKYSRLGAVRKRTRFVHKFIRPNKKPDMIPFTNYFTPNLKTVNKNILCFSGQPGIGKSYHFRNIAYQQSLKRPALYVSFKASGTNQTFQEDIAKKLDYGQGENPPMLSEIINAVRKIHQLNTKPYKLWSRFIMTTIGYAWACSQVLTSQLLDSNEGIILGTIGTTYAYYLCLIYPFILQTFRKTRPLVIFDDLNKIDKIGQLAEISRFLQLHQENMANVILISSDEETWFKLRKQPGLKDRLRQRVIVYNHTYTAKKMLEFLKNEKNYKDFAEQTRINPLFNQQLVMMLIQELIGNKQVTFRRLKSILLLNDEQEYQYFVEVLTNYHNKKINLKQVISQITQILYNSEMETICAKLKHIKRETQISDSQFIKQMKTLLEKGKLLSDNKLGPYLMSYNIVRDSQSQYVFNGKFMYTVFQMAFEEYIKDYEQYHNKRTGLLQSDIKFDASVATRQQQQPHKKRNIPEQNKSEDPKN